MRKLLLTSFLFIIYSFLNSNTLSAQSCVPTNLNNTTINLSCNTPCTTLSFKVPHLKSTSNYKLLSIPYTPFQYIVTTGGTEDANLYNDDEYSNLYSMPFSFCFYDSTYSKVVVGSNGIITFDETNANTNNAYPITQQIPYAGGTQNQITPAYYPKASIMGVYSDLDPRTSPPNSGNASPQDRLIQWRVEGTAPCRKFIVSYYHIGVFGNNGPGTCGYVTPNTFQIVCYESTGLIDVFIEKKNCFPTTDGGNAILGIQNWERNLALAAPGRNATNWVASGEGFRFVPSGNLSRFVSSELLSMTGSVLATADTATTTAGLLDINFPNICPPPGATQYIVRTTFGSCPAGTNMISLDTITISRNNRLPVTTVLAPTTCGNNVGSITVNVATGVGITPYQYSINGGALQSSNVFSGLTAGIYNVYATDAGGCDTSYQVNVIASSSLTATFTSTNQSCPALANGSITVTPQSGSAPYTYSANAGLAQASGNFTNLAAGSYNIVYTDALLCTGSITVIIGPGTNITATLSSTSTSCAGAADGSITITPTSGVGPYTYSLDAGAPQSGNVFTGVSSGNHSIVIKDSRGCSITVSRTIAAGTSLIGSIFQTAVSCPGANDGTVTLVPTNGVAPFTYQLDAGAPQATGTFTGVSAGLHTVVFKDINGCTGSRSINVGAGASSSTSAVTSSTSCPTATDGTITITPVAGAIYTLNPGNITNTTGVFTGLAPGTYTASFVIPPATCIGAVSPNPVVAAGPIITSSFTQVNPVCSNINNGSISITPQLGSAAPYSVTLTSIGAPVTQTGNAPVIFTNLAPGIYNYTFTSASGCIGTGGPITLSTNPALMMPATLTMPLCNGNANGSISFNPLGGVAPFQYSNNAGASYQAGNTFTGLAAGVHTFRIKDNVGCTKDTSITLLQPTILSATAANTATAGCSNNDGTLTATGIGGTSPYSFTIAGLSVNSTGATTGVFTGLASGNYVVTVTDAKGCTTTAATTIILVDNMFLTLGPDVSICVESSINFNPLTNPGTSVFAWRSPNALLSTINDPTLKRATATPTDTAIYILNAKWGTCVREDTIVVNVLHKPIPNAGLDTAICNISYAFLRGSASNLSGTVNYNWTPIAGISSPSLSTTRVYPAGNDTTYIYTLTVKDNYGCNFSVTDDVNVRVQPPVPAYAGNDSIAVKGIAQQLNSTGGVSYLWSPAYPLNSASNQNPLATLQNDTKFIVQVTDIAGCIGYDTVFLKVYVGPTYYIPNAFSPNGDGLNDIFRAIPVGIKKTTWFRIFNRFGETVFETNQWLKGWDGTYKGKKQAIGAYVWIIKGTDLNGKPVEMKGTVMLVQ